MMNIKIKNIFRQLPEFDEDLKIREEFWEKIDTISDDSTLDDLNNEISNKDKSFFDTKIRFDSKINSMVSSLGIIFSIISGFTLFNLNTKEYIAFTSLIFLLIGYIFLFLAFILLLYNQRFKKEFSEIKEISFFEFAKKNQFKNYLKHKIFVLAFNSAQNNFYLEYIKRGYLLVPYFIIVGFIISISSSFYILVKEPNKSSKIYDQIKNIPSQTSTINENLENIKTELSNINNTIKSMDSTGNQRNINKMEQK